MSTALQSLYGRGDADKALAGLVGGQARTQEVLTPAWILDAAREALGGTIVLDPCASSDPDNWFATANVTLHPDAAAIDAELAAAQTKPEIARLKALVKPYYLAGALAEDWDVGPAYVNFPFAFAEPWLRKCQAHKFPTVALTPIRPHRAWFFPLCVGGELVCLSYDVKFVGHDQAFPAPLGLLSFGCTLPALGARETWRLRV